MSISHIFIDRRHRKNRRVDPDPCENLSVDLYHRKRRKSTERRDTNRRLEDDYFAVTDEDNNSEFGEKKVSH